MEEKVNKFQNSLLKFISLEKSPLPQRQESAGKTRKLIPPPNLPSLQVSVISIGSSSTIDSRYVYSQFGRRKLSTHSDVTIPVNFFKPTSTTEEQVRKKVRTKFLLKNVNRLQKLIRSK